MKHIPNFKKKSWTAFKSLLFFLLAGCSLVQGQNYLTSTDNSYKMLQLANNSQSNGTPIVLGDRNTGNTALDGQALWIYDETTSTIRLAANPNKCIHRAEQLELEGAALYLYDFISSGHPNQEWVLEEGRIKLKSYKSYCIDLESPNFNAGNTAKLRAVDPTSIYQKWLRRNKPHMILTADQNWHRIESPGDTYLDVAIPDPCPYPYLTIRARGGDGGFRSVKDIFTGKEVVKAEGGEGATLTATYKIGTGANEFRPGTNIRLVIGTAGESRRNDGHVRACGGGGGTGVIYEAPGLRTADYYYPWEMLLVAGGGGGSESSCCVGSNGEPAYPNSYYYEKVWTGRIDFHDNNDGYHPDSGNQKIDGAGYRADGDPAPLGKEGFINGAGAGFKNQDGYPFPLGGRYTETNTSYGGFGFGGGGRSNTNSGNPGGGGGYSGGWHDRKGGLSYHNWSKAMPGTDYAIQNNTTPSSRNGYVEYQFSNTAPASRGQFEFGLQSQNVEILRSGAYSLKWQADGNLVLYGPSGAVWASHTDGRGKDLAFQGDGNLVIYENGSAIWSSRTSDGQQEGGKGGRTLALNSEGVLIIADQGNKSIWRATGPAAYRNYQFEYGLQNVELLKCGTYTLKWQADGNLVLYGPSGAVWASHTNGRGNKLTFQPDGNLVIYQNGTGIWDTRTADVLQGGKGGRKLLLTADGWLAVLNQDGNAVWGFDAQP